jgi:hypothetical protein
MPADIFWKLRGAFRWAAKSTIANKLASQLWKPMVCRKHAERLWSDFGHRSERLCDFCASPLYIADAHSTLARLEYGHCRHCNVLLSGAPMPDYGEQALYAPSARFLDENIAHYERLFSARPSLLEAIRGTGITRVIDLAGGTGIFPRMLAMGLPELQEIRIVEVGEYADDARLHTDLNARLKTEVPLSFARQDVISFLHASDNVCPNRVLISFVHFIDHLRHPDVFLDALRNFARGHTAYVLIYCHALDSYKGHDWFVINTGTPGEHQIVYSHRALKKLVSRYGQVLHGDVYFDDQYLLVKLDT